MIKKSLVLSVAAVLGVPVVGSNPVNAQGLEEIVVTARKRDESAQDIPVAIRVISAETIRKMNITSLEKIAEISPEFTVGRGASGSGAQLRLRGIGSNSTSIGIEQSVAVIIDDVYYGQGRFINEGMFDLTSVELLKGPQALFFGKNATAGAISLTTANPTDEFELMTQVSHEFEASQTTGDIIVSGPLTDTLGARLALRYSKASGGLIENRATAQPYNVIDLATGDVTQYIAEPGDKDQPGLEEYMARLTLAFDPTDRLSLNLKTAVSYSENNNPAWNYIQSNTLSGFHANSPETPARERFVNYMNNIPREIAPFVKHAGDGRLVNEYESFQITGAIEYQFENFTLTSVTNYQEYDNRFVGDFDYQSSVRGTGTWAVEYQEWRAFSEELRLLSQFDYPVNFMVGVLYQEIDRDYEIDVLTAGLANSNAPTLNRFSGGNKDSFTKGETISPFFQVIWDITPELEFSAGARYTRETKDSEFVQPYVNPGLRGVWRQGEVAAADQTFTEWSPEVALNWALADDLMVYVAYKTGYKSGGFSNSGIYSVAGTVNDFTFSPETAKGFEIGLKSTLMNNQLRFNATAYTYEIDSLQVDFLNTPTFAFITFNAGLAESQGVELDFEYAPASVQGLRVMGALNYNKSEYKDFIAPCWNGQRPSEGCTEIVPGTVGTPGQDISGKPTAVAPEITAVLGFAYDRPIYSGWNLGLSLSTQYIDDYYQSQIAQPLSKQDSYFRLDGSISLYSDNDSWTISLIGKNLTNEFIGEAGADTPSTGGGTGTEAGIWADHTAYAANPRTIAVQITKFW